MGRTAGPRLQLAAVGLTIYRQSVLGQLGRVFERCDDHGIPLSALEIPKHLCKYHEANVKLANIIKHETEDAETKRELLAARSR